MNIFIEPNNIFTKPKFEKYHNFCDSQPVASLIYALELLKLVHLQSAQQGSFRLKKSLVLIPRKFKVSENRSLQVP